MKMINKPLLSSFLAMTIMSLASFAQPGTPVSKTRILIWGIPEKTCDAYGGKYDTSSGLSEWEPMLSISDKSPDNISGTLTLGTKKLQFASQSKNDNAGNPVIKTFSLKSNDNTFSISASAINESEIEIKSGRPKNEAVYVYNFIKEGSKPKLIKGSDLIFNQMINTQVALLLPLLSYALGSEGGITGNFYPVSMPIHRMAMSIAQEKDILLLTIEENRLVPLRISQSTFVPRGTSGSSDQTGCAGRMPGTTAQECYGQCGPFWNGQCICWDWACGDCCCHQACLQHDLACKCNNVIRCYGLAFTVLLCSGPCNNPGAMPACGCPSGQTYCSYTRSCQATGAQCRPVCGPGDRFCERLGRCVRKTQCPPNTNTSCGTCPSGSICYQGQCLLI